MNLESFEKIFDQYLCQVCENHPDPSHDILHVRRVVESAKWLATAEGADLAVVVPAAYLHDCVWISKADSRRSLASRISAEKAGELLRSWHYPEEYIPPVMHAIAAHSFSGRIFPETLEARVVQDADRLDAMGAIGLFRCFAFSGLALRPCYHFVDPFCESRSPDDKTNTLDHFFIKLLKLAEGLNTESARREGQKRMEVLERFVSDLKREVHVETSRSF